MAKSQSILAGRPPLYAIADFEICQKNNIQPIDFARAFWNAGGQILQYRDKVSAALEVEKNFEAILSASRGFKSLCILNDYRDIAAQFNCPVHLGQDDGPPPEKILTMGFEDGLDEQNQTGEASLGFEGRMSYGRSTHSLEEIAAATKDDPPPNYIAFGQVFTSKVRTDAPEQEGLVGEVVEAWPGDIVFIGGITASNVEELPSGDRFFYALISDFFAKGSKAVDVEQYARDFIDQLSKA